MGCHFLFCLILPSVCHYLKEDNCKKPSVKACLTQENDALPPDSYYLT